MRLQRNCKVCDKKFTAIKTTQYFCSRRCFKRDYYLRNKAKMAAETANPKFPIRTCAYCKLPTELDFDPIRLPERFDIWQCLHCGLSNDVLWRYIDNPASYQIIKEILVTYTITFSHSTTI